MQPLAKVIDAMLHVDRCRQLLVARSKSSLVDCALQDRCLQCVRKIRSLVEQRARTEIVFGDGGPFAEEGMVVIRKRFCVLWHQKLRPVLDFVLIDCVKWIAFEREGLGEA